MPLPSPILLIGPSGCGKTTLGRYAASVITDLEFRDLDALVSKKAEMPAMEYLPEVGNDRFMHACVEAAAQAAADSAARLLLLAVGAGALQSANAVSWIGRSPSICLRIQPQSTYQRTPLGANRSYDEYLATEFSPHRQAIYDAAKYSLDLSDLSVELARERFVGFMLGLMAAEEIPG